MPVDVAHRVHERRLLEVRVVEREGALPIHLAIGVRVHRRSVDEALRDVDVAAGDRQLERLGRAAHREQEPAALDELANLLGDVLLERRHVREAKPLRRRRVLLQQIDEPRRVAIAEVELVELAREVLVVQMQPVVLREIAALDLVVVDRRVVDARRT